MLKVVSYLGQATFYAVAAVLTGFVSSQPTYHQVGANTAQIKLALSHGGRRLENCRKLSSEELAKLPTAQRRPLQCSRERVPVVVRLSLDNVPVYEATLSPTGLWKDGPATAYEKFLVPTGHHVIEAELRDSKRASGFDYQSRIQVDLKPRQNLAIEFEAEHGGFHFR